MDGAIEVLRKEFGGLRTGRASASLLEPVHGPAYGGTVPLNQVASVSVPEPRMITVQVWDRGVVKAVDKAIREAGLGLNPQTEGQVIRVPIPELNEERRRELTRVAAKYAEQARVVGPQCAARRRSRRCRRLRKGRRNLAGRAAQAAAGRPEADRRLHQAHRRDAGAKGQRNPPGLMSIAASPRPRAAAHRDHHGRQRPLGEGPRPAADRRAIGAAPRRLRRTVVAAARARGAVPDAVRLFVGELEAAARRDRRSDGAAAPLSARRNRRTAPQRRSPQGDRRPGTADPDIVA